MQKSKIKIKAYITIHVNTRKTAQIVAYNWCNNTFDVVNNNGEAETQSTNVTILEFDI